MADSPVHETRNIPRARAVSVLALLSALALGACADEEPTGPRVQRERPQFVTVGDFNDFVRVTVSGEPALTPNFGHQYQAVVPASPSEIFLSRGDDWWLKVNVTSSSATYSGSGHQDLAAIGQYVQMGGWAFGPSDFWGAQDDDKLFRFDGAWSVPNAGIGADFLGIWGASPTDVWAVGGTDRSGGPGSGVIAHNTGGGWTSTGGANWGPLWGIFGFAANDIWAVGDFATFLHYDGTGWTQLPAPRPGIYRDVHGSSPSEIWAAGNDFDTGITLRWNTTTGLWEDVPFPFDVVLYAIQVVGPGDVYAAGGGGIYHFDGLAWSKIDDPALLDPTTGANLSFFDMRIGHGRLYAPSTNGYLVIGSTAPADNTLAMTVLDPDGITPASNATVTLTDVNTGSFLVECSDANGLASFTVPDGSYIVHARNLEICTNSFLRVWPEPSGVIHNTANTEAQNRVGVILRSGNSVTLTPDNYKQAVAQPLVLSGGVNVPVTLQFQLGATLSCQLLDGGGSAFTLVDDEQIYNVLPFDDESGLPPVGNPNGFPRGIGVALATIFATEQSTDCSVSGMPAGNYVLETNTVIVNNEPQVFREPYSVTEEEAQSGETVVVEPEAQEQLALSNYLVDPIGDAQGPTDLGSAVWGWTLTSTGVSDEVVINSGFVRRGDTGSSRFKLQVRYARDDASVVDLVAEADCQFTGGVYGCVLRSGAPAEISVTGKARIGGGRTRGTLTWRVDLSADDPAIVQIRLSTINGNSTNDADAAPNQGFDSAPNPDTDPAGGNTFMIKGD